MAFKHKAFKRSLKGIKRKSTYTKPKGPGRAPRAYMASWLFFTVPSLQLQTPARMRHALMGLLKPPKDLWDSQRTSEALEGLNGPLRALNCPAQQGTRAINLKSLKDAKQIRNCSISYFHEGDVRGGKRCSRGHESCNSDSDINNNISILIAEVAMIKAFRPHASGQEHGLNL